MEEKLQSVMIQGNSLNPHENLAYEECLVDYAAKHPNICIFYLWQNKDAVVLGRNQNIYREVNLPMADMEHITPARRKTGGGAVFHDLGNLNYTVAANENIFTKNEITEMILETLQHDFGITAYASGRNDLCSGGCKFSGSAYLKKGSVSLNHGTLMVNVDIDKMYRCLTPDSRKLETKGIPSVRSRVMNLCGLNKNIGIDDLRTALFSCFRAVCKKKKISVIPEIVIDEAMYQNLAASYASREWVYGTIQPMGRYDSQRFGWGSIQIGLSFSEGLIKTCVIDTDALAVDILLKVSKRLEGMPVCPACFKQLAQEAESEIEQDIYRYLADSIGDKNEGI